MLQSRTLKTSLYETSHNSAMTGLISMLQKLDFTASHTLREQMAHSEVKQPFISSKTKLTEAGGIICMK